MAIVQWTNAQNELQQERTILVAYGSNPNNDPKSVELPISDSTSSARKDSGIVSDSYQVEKNPAHPITIEPRRPSRFSVQHGSKETPCARQKSCSPSRLSSGSLSDSSVESSEKSRGPSPEKGAGGQTRKPSRFLVTHLPLGPLQTQKSVTESPTSMTPDTSISWPSPTINVSPPTPDVDPELASASKSASQSIPAMLLLDKLLSQSFSKVIPELRVARTAIAAESLVHAASLSSFSDSRESLDSEHLTVPQEILALDRESKTSDSHPAAFPHCNYRIPSTLACIRPHVLAKKLAEQNPASPDDTKPAPHTIAKYKPVLPPEEITLPTPSPPTPPPNHVPQEIPIFVVSSGHADSVAASVAAPSAHLDPAVLVSKHGRFTVVREHSTQWRPRQTFAPRDLSRFSFYRNDGQDVAKPTL
ncbi:hypothetical protein DFS34DRAFT_356524 [Phlyctochytrium arcticum]|nr:hypothetical protein DFS34DRAFT_356524 [Phlyctochytrium arcticum]